MRRLLGFILFWIAIGMIIMMMIENKYIAFGIIFMCLIAGYNLFCSP